MAFADIFISWCVTLGDPNAEPYGASGGTHMDTYKMVNYDGWKIKDVIHLYVTVGILCLIALILFYVQAIRQADAVVAMRLAASDPA